MTDRARLPHAILDRNSRINKANKIVSIVGKGRFSQCERVLEIGCGSGVISHVLSTMSETTDFYAVDVADNRIESEGYKFSIVGGTSLQFPDNHFDLVISNHVIEHVGPEDCQVHHLKEIKRVLSDEGVAYLAVPNKWGLFEPHYRLPLLSWLPERVSSAYVRAARKGNYYDCRPLSARGIEHLFRQCGLEFEDVTITALKETLRIECPDSLAAKHAGSIPAWILALAMPVIPTIIYLLRRGHR
ncbi:class I SAM-dependent methyltransferase [Pseudoxanthomonas sp. UTMC 1351]|uniref:class I SAM-dependent methyltransferase n=1 Tax=Pseudoxanthomonas sp. UTMC 1351 TaxID=2695853 RepID=UPI0034CF5C7F